MYDKLVKDLRICAEGERCDQCGKWEVKQNGGRNACEYAICTEAADAIEELATIVAGYRKRMWTGSNWIPVGEQLPEDFKKVLVFWEEHSEPMIDTAFWREDFKSFDCSHWKMDGEKITHWMPLPEPPKEEDR